MKTVTSFFRNTFHFFLSPFAFSAGALYYKLTHRTPTFSRKAMRRLFVMTNGRLNDASAAVSKTIHPPYEDIEANGILGNLSSTAINTIAAQIEKDGYHVFEQELSPEIVDALTKFATETPVYPLLSNQEGIAYAKEGVLFDRNNIIAPRYQFRMEQLAKNPTIQQLIFDQSILAVVQAYLGSQPVLDLVAMWWSAPFGGVGKSAAAQMYHFDMARLKFLKIFFYVTDVHEDNGPHCYVKNSHKRLPTPLKSDGRKTDEQVAQHFPKENLLEICGKKGTILAVDTRGLHKGKELVKDERLLLQLEFANSIFGANYVELKDYQLPEKEANLLKKYPFTYGQVFK